MAQSLSAQNLSTQGPGLAGRGLKAAPAAKQMMVALAGVAGVILLGGGGVLMGLNSHLAALQTIARQKQTQVDGSEGIAKRYLTTQAAYTETQDRIQCLEASVPPKSYVPTLLGQLQALAATTHLNVLAVRPAAPPPPAAPVAVHPVTGGDAAASGAASPKAPPPPPYDTLDIDVDTTGSYADTAAFLYSLTRFPKIISVTAVQMHPSASADKANPQAAPLVTTNLKLVAFMFHADDAVPGTAQAAPTAALQPAAVAASPVPPVAAGTPAGAVQRAAAGAVGVTKAANARGAVGAGTL